MFGTVGAVDVYVGKQNSATVPMDTTAMREIPDTTGRD